MNALCFSLLLLGATAPLGPGNHLQDIKVDGRTRSFLVHVPRQYDPAQPTPAVLAFHGAGTNAALMAHYSGLNRTSERAGFIVVYPNGTGLANILQVFNVGLFAGPIDDHLPDDIEFVRRLLDELPKLVNIDRRRVFATGISNGGMMCYRLASELSDRIAAIAPVAGALTSGPCQPKRPVPVLHFHGTDDKLVPLAGRAKDDPRHLVMQSLDATIDAWVKLNGCPSTPQVRDEPDRAEDGTRVECRTFGPGKDGAEVVLYLIHGGGHTWPGARMQPQFLGLTCQDISANDLMWEFFQRHPMVGNDE